MADNIVTIPYSYFPDFSVGRPLFNASIWVGQPELNPGDIPTNQKPIKLRTGDGTEVTVSQPVNTGSGGVINYNGSPATIIVDGAYSIRVDNNQGSQIYYSKNVTNGSPITIDSIGDTSIIFFDTVADASSNPNSKGVPLKAGDSVIIKERLNGLFTVSSSGTANGFDVIQIGTSSLNLTLDASCENIAECYGVVFDGVTDNTNAFDAAHDRLDDGSKLFFHGGSSPALMNVYNEKLQLEGIGRCDIKAFSGSTLDGFAIRLGYHNRLSTWDYYTITNIQAIADSGVNGIDLNRPSDPELAGRWSFNNDVFGGDLSKGVYGFRKSAGNIGNTFRDATFRNVDFGYHAVGLGPSVMHVGADNIQGHFESIDKAAIYIDGNNVEGQGGTKVNAIIEGCDGFALFMKDVRNTPFQPFIFDLWIENVARVSPVTIDGISYTTRQIRLEDCNGIIIDNVFLKSIELINSSVLLRNPRLDEKGGVPDIQIDTNSFIRAENVNLNGTAPTEILVESVMNQTEPNFSGMRMPLRNIKNYSSAQIVQPYTTQQSLTGSQTVVGSVVNEGTIEKECNFFNVASGVGATLLGQETFSVTNDRYYVWSVNVKLNTGTMSIGFTDAVNLGGVQVKGNDWFCYAGIVRTQSSGQVRLRINNLENNTTFLLQGCQLKEFTNKDDAFEYINSKQVAWT